MTPKQVTIHPPTLDDSDALFEFESANRTYFERWINARDENFYEISSVRQSIMESIENRNRDIAHQYTVKLQSTIVGRVNLTAVARRYFNKALLGYRIGEAFQGNGYASQSVALILDIAFKELKLWRIEASVRSDNVGSTRVLENNGFKVYGRTQQSMFLQGDWFDIRHFECQSPSGPITHSVKMNDR